MKYVYYCELENKEFPIIGAFLGQPANLQCPLDPVVGVRQLYWMTPLGDRISPDMITSAGYNC